MKSRMLWQLGLVTILLSTLVSAGRAEVGEWTNLTPTGALPPGARDMGLAYDSQGDRLILVGTADAQTWIMNLGGTPAWTSLAIPAPPVQDMRAVCDPVANRVVVLTSNSEVYTLDLANPTGWVKQSPIGNTPPPRRFFAVARDGARNRLLLFGGGPYTGLFNDVWALSLSGTLTWTQLWPSGTPPAPRWAPVAVYDSRRDQLVIATGSTSTGYTTTNDVWALSLSGTPTWSQLHPSGAPPIERMDPAAVYDPALDRMVLFGGYLPIQTGDTWALDLATTAWIPLTPLDVVPGARFSHEAVYRSAHPEMIVHGGSIEGGSLLNDTWALGLGVLSGPPVVFYFAPSGGQIGDEVSITGQLLSTATKVRFNGVEAPILTASYTQVTTQVPVGATSGPIEVVTPAGSALSAKSFWVGLPPVIASISSDSGHVGDDFTVLGAHFTGTTSVSIGGTGSAQFTVLADTLLSVTVDSLATTGPITVTTPVASATSGFSFLVLADDPRPRLIGVHDVPGHQGGKVVLSWRASGFDQPHYSTITGYRVWRRANVTSPAAAAGRASGPFRVRRDVPQDGSAAPVFWESLAEIPAAFLRGYAYTAATWQDSTGGGNPYTAFFVEALTSNPYVFYESSVDSGYSVDNLAPPVPMPFTATYSSGTAALHWRPSTAPDFSAFRLFRGGSATFTPAPGNLIFAGSDTGYVDHVGDSYYKLAAVDVHGNVSRYALVSPTSPVATLASLVDARWTGTAASLVWFGSSLSGVSVNLYRGVDGGTWSPAARLVADGDGFMRYLDADVVAGHRYAYRLGIPDGDTEQFAGETSIEIPAGRLGMMAVASNPVRGDQLGFVATLAGTDPATVRVLDMAGRVVREAGVSPNLAGTYSLPLAGGASIRPGVYFLEVRQGGLRAITRFVYLR